MKDVSRETDYAIPVKHCFWTNGEEMFTSAFDKAPTTKSLACVTVVSSFIWLQHLLPQLQLLGLVKKFRDPVRDLKTPISRAFLASRSVPVRWRLHRRVQSIQNRSQAHEMPRPTFSRALQLR